MDWKMNRYLLDAFDNFRDRHCWQDVVYLDALQNLDEPNQDVDQTFQDVHLENLVHRLDVVVDVELHYLLRMDYFQDEVDVELLELFHQKLRMDYFLGVGLQVYFPQLALRSQELVSKQVAQRFQRAMPLAPPNQRRVRRQVRRQVRG
jgi:hypothetical protein